MEPHSHFDTFAAEDLLFAMQQRNLVYNYNFLNYSNQQLNTQNNTITYNHPDGWVYLDSESGGSISFNVANNCCRIIKSPAKGLMAFSQAIHEFPRWAKTLQGKTVTAEAIVSTPKENNAQMTISLDDGVNTVTRSVHFVPNEKKELSITMEVSPNATQLVVALESTSAGATFDIYKVYANLGLVALPTLMPMVEGFIGERKQYVSMEIPPATELSLCEASVEVPDYCSRLDSFLNGAFGLGTDNRSLLPDMRGYFSRAWDNGAGIDPDAGKRTALGQGSSTGDNVGTVEPDMFAKHTHQLTFSTSTTTLSGTSTPNIPLITPTNQEPTNPEGGSETRSKNIAELFTMKWA